MQQDANVVRLDASRTRVLVPFPEAKILRARVFGDQLAVTHAGETTVYENPQALAEAMREHDPVAMERLETVDAAVTRARELVTLGEQREADARALFAQAEVAMIEAARVHNAAVAFSRKLKLAALTGAGLALVFIVAVYAR